MHATNDFPTYFMSEEDVRRIDTSFSNNEV